MYDDVRERLAKEVDLLLADVNRLQKKIAALFDCKHNFRADRCAECKGVTAIGATVEELAHELRERGLLTVELREGVHAAAKTTIPKKIIGLGIGAVVVGGILAWQGGRFVWQLIRRV